jgi:acetyl coenzyme A synthetase (ADP forming)-like protein
VALRDGSSIHIRPVQSIDQQAMRAFFAGLSSDSIGFRFFGLADIDWAADWSVDVDYADRYALAATAGANHAIVAHGVYVRIDSRRAEVAFVVADAWQGRGIATIMLAHLAVAAERNGISLFTAEVMPANHRMIQVFRDSGFTVAVHPKDGAIGIDFPTSLDGEARLRFQAREQHAAVSAVGSFLTPHSVAVIGASRRSNAVGTAILHNLIRGGFTGSVYPVNPHAHTIQGCPAYASIADVPDPVELAVVAVPATEVIDVARGCGTIGVRALLVISAGFAEAGTEGAQRRHELLEICRDSGMRLIGPNCFGVLNTAQDVRLNATFEAHSPPPGKIGFFTQSGGLGIAMIEAAGRLGLGISSFVSVGDKADVSGNDLLEYWEQDAATEVILLYLESFGNPHRFARIARRVSATKPIVSVKRGRSPAGALATSSHIGALISASDRMVDALFEQAGVIRAETVHELFDVAALLSAQPVPHGSRVAIVSNGGGPAILCADACQAKGLEVVELDDDVRKELALFLAPEASLGNPVDMSATASAGDYRRAIEVLAARHACDAIITIFVPPLVTDGGDVAREIERAAERTGEVTLASVFMGVTDGVGARAVGGDTRVPTFAFPEDAAGALAHAARYARWRARPAGDFSPPPDCRPDEAAATIAAALAGGGGWLGPRDVTTLLDCYGLPLIATRIVAGAGIFATATGVELLVGVVHDESFGPVIACGAAGTSADLVKDVAVRITPLSDLDAAEMLRSLRIFPLLDGHGGATRCDIAAIEDVLLRLSALVDAHPEVAEIDFNPLLAGPDGALILDAHVRVHAAPARRPPFAL